jgi:hypothetical protein
MIGVLSYCTVFCVRVTFTFTYKNHLHFTHGVQFEYLKKMLYGKYMIRPHTVPVSFFFFNTERHEA